MSGEMRTFLKGLWLGTLFMSLLCFAYNVTHHHAGSVVANSVGITLSVYWLNRYARED